MSPSPGSFLIALAIIALSLAVLEDVNKRAAYALAFLIVLGSAVFQWPGLARFAAFIRKELNK